MDKDKDTKAWSILPWALVHPWLGKDRACFVLFSVCFVFVFLTFPCAVPIYKRK